MKLPDKRYSANPEFCGYETPRYVARFCGERLRDRDLWPDCVGYQAPSFETRAEAIRACRDYEAMRQKILTGGAKQQARANLYEANPQ